MKKSVSMLFFLTPLLTLPFVALAFAGQPGVIVSVPSVIDNVFGNIIWPLFISLAVLLLLISGLLFLLARGEPSKVATARLALLWGVIGVIVSLLAFSIPTIVRMSLGV